MPRGIEHEPVSIVLHQFRILYPRVIPPSDRHPDGKVLQVEELYMGEPDRVSLGKLIESFCKSSPANACVQVGTIVVPRRTLWHDVQCLPSCRMFTVKSPQRI